MGDIELVFDPFSVILIEELYAVSHCSLTLIYYQGVIRS